MAPSDVKFNQKNNVSNIFGDQSLSKQKGWESYTTGLGGSVKLRLGHAQGVPSYDHNTVSIDEPLRLGRFIGVWTRLPPFFHSEVKEYWKYFFQDKLLEVSGVTDNEISLLDRTMGSVGRSESYAGSYKENNGKFTLKIPEVKGSPVRKIMKYYVSGISDPVTGTAHFHGNTDLRFSKVNYGGDFMFILLGPTMRPDDIEYACLWVNAFPSKDFIGHLNSGAIGEPGSADLAFDVEFSGTYIQNNTVNRMAQIVTEAVGLYKDTVEDVILPSYMYEEYLDDANVGVLKSLHGSNLKQKIDNAQQSEPGDDTGIIDDIAGSYNTAGTTHEQTVTPGSGLNDAGTNFDSELDDG